MANPSENLNSLNELIPALMKSGKNSLVKIVTALKDADIPFSFHKQEFSDKIEEFVSKRI